MDKNKGIFLLLSLVSFVLIFTACTLKENREVTMEAFVFNELWDLETEAVNTIMQLQETGDDEKAIALVCKKSGEIMNKAKKKLEVYSGASEGLKDLYREQVSCIDVFFTTITKIEKNRLIYLVTDITDAWGKLLHSRDTFVPGVLRGMDMDDSNKRNTVDNYLEASYMFKRDGDLMDLVEQELPTEPDSVSLLYAYAFLLHNNPKENKEYQTLTKLKQVPELSTTIQDWVAKRLYCMELYQNCGTPGFWTGDKIKLERGIIASQVRTGFDIENWLSRCNQEGEYLLAENLAQLFMNKKEILTRNGKKTSGAVYMQEHNFGHFTKLTEIIESIKSFIEAFTTQDSETAAGYITEVFMIEDTGDDFCERCDKKDFQEYLSHLYRYIEDYSYYDQEYKIDGQTLSADIKFMSSYYPEYDYVKTNCTFGYNDPGIFISGINTERHFDEAEMYGGCGCGADYYDDEEYYGYDEYGYNEYEYYGSEYDYDPESEYYDEGY